MKNFWLNLKKPFFALAPLDDVTDTVFRQMIAKIGEPDVFFTEFVSVDGLCSVGAKALMPRLKLGKSEKNVIAQLWGLKPENFFKIARQVEKLGFSGIDLNMGCPKDDVIKKGACSGLINNPQLAKDIIEACKKGAPNLPISVKTRLGFHKIQTEEWLGFLLSQNLDAITIHGRTVSEMSKVPAHWDEIGKVVKMRDQMGLKTIIIGNGDVKDMIDGFKKAEEFGVDGIMIGRGIFQNPWVFKNNYQPSLSESLITLVEHARLFCKTWGQTKNFAILRKFFKAYVSNFSGANKLRIDLLQTNNIEEVENLITNFLSKKKKSFEDDEITIQFPQVILSSRL